jgi:hypothetical protein
LDSFIGASRAGLIETNNGGLGRWDFVGVQAQLKEANIAAVNEKAGSSTVSQSENGHTGCNGTNHGDNEAQRADAVRPNILKSGWSRILIEAADGLLFRSAGEGFGVQWVGR